MTTNGAPENRPARPQSTWRRPEDVLTPEQLEHAREQGRAARALVPDSVYNRAIWRLQDALRRQAQRGPDEQ